MRNAVVEGNAICCSSRWIVGLHNVVALGLGVPGHPDLSGHRHIENVGPFSLTMLSWLSRYTESQGVTGLPAFFLSYGFHCGCHA